MDRCRSGLLKPGAPASVYHFRSWRGCARVLRRSSCSHRNATLRSCSAAVQRYPVGYRAWRGHTRYHRRERHTNPDETCWAALLCCQGFRVSPHMRRMLPTFLKSAGRARESYDAYPGGLRGWVSDPATPCCSTGHFGSVLTADGKLFFCPK